MPQVYIYTVKRLRTENTSTITRLIIPSSQGPSVLANSTSTFFDVEIAHEGFATSDFFVLGKLQQPHKMNFSESPDSDQLTKKKLENG
jgi:hypothetical protein